MTLPEKLGLIHAGKHRMLSFEVSGRIESIADSGAAILRGEPIANLDLRLEQARLKQAQLRLRDAVANLERNRGLKASHAGSAKALESAEIAVDIARAEIDATREQLQRRTLRAPFDGVVAERFLETGEVANPAIRVASFMELDRVRLVLGVPDFQVNSIEIGAEASVVLPAVPSRKFTGTVAEVAAAAAEGEHLFEIKIVLDNTDGLLRPGMSARTRIVTGSLDAVMVVPAELLVRRAGRQVIFFADGDRARSVDAESAILDGDQLLLSGKIPYRELLVRGHRDVVDGAPIERNNRILAGLEPPR